jgi:hypothetical protein
MVKTRPGVLVRSHWDRVENGEERGAANGGVSWVEVRKKRDYNARTYLAFSRLWLHQGDSRR